MTDNDKHKLSDDELDALMDGSHAVSRAYQDLEKASPPPELDERILARARASVDRKPGFSKDVFIRPYATAATVLVCLGITFMFVNAPDVPTPADLRSLDEPAQRVIEFNREQEQAEEPQQAPTAVSAEQVIDNLVTATDEADAVGSTADTGGAVTPARREAPQAVPTANLLDLVEQRSLEEAVESRERSVASTAQQQIAAPVTYRNDREDWLREIARLREAGDTVGAREEEMLFLESYPGTDIDAALAELEIP